MGLGRADAPVIQTARSLCNNPAVPAPVSTHLVLATLNMSHKVLDR